MSDAGPRPTVSVVIAAYNGATLVEETLASLATQTLTDWEAIVVDDKSPDDTLAVLRAWPDTRVRVIAAKENGGPVRARNRAFAEARGRYVAGLDQDDLCAPTRFARQIAYLDAHPDTVVLGTQALLLEDGRTGPSQYAPVTTPTLIEWLLRIENPLVWSSTMMRGDVARTLVPFTRPEILYAEDFDLYHRMAPLGRIARIDDALLQYRVHAGGASQRFTEQMAASAAVVLAGAYAALFGDDAPALATLVVRHLMLRHAIPDAASLSRLADTLSTLQQDFLATRACSPEDVRLIRWETARRWAGVTRAGLRSGTITLAHAVAARRDHLGLGHAGFEDLALSRAIGVARRLAS